MMILDIPIEAIEHDYFLTDAGLESEHHLRVAEVREMGMPDAWAGTTRNMITGVSEHLDEKYGGLDGYLDYIGFTKADRTKVRDALLY